MPIGHGCGCRLWLWLQVMAIGYGYGINAYLVSINLIYLNLCSKEVFGIVGFTEKNFAT